MNYKIKSLFSKNMSLKEKYELLLDILYDLYTDLIVVPSDTLYTFLFWGWNLRKNREWCMEYFFYCFTYLNLKQYIKYCNKYGHLQWNSNSDNKAM